MTRLLTLAASVLLLGTAPVWAQTSTASPSFGVCNRTTGDIADCLNRAIAERNDAATAVNNQNYGAGGAGRYTAPGASQTTTTTTTYSRTTTYPPPYPGASR